MCPKATHNPNVVDFEIATKRKIMQTPRGPADVEPGDVIIYDGPKKAWPIDIDDFLRRYGGNLDKEAREYIERFYPGKLKDGKL